MYSIEIDFDVRKALIVKRETESVTYNDVLRGLLELPTSPNKPEPSVTNPEIQLNAGDAKDSWTKKGVTFPAGTEFRANYEGRMALGKVESGALYVNGTKYTSPSAAAGGITGTSVNGWLFWECRKSKEDEWHLIDSLRKKS